jgi:nodulation protein E
LFALAATSEALRDAGLHGDSASLSSAAIVYGSASGGNATVEMTYQRMFEMGSDDVQPSTIPRMMSSAPLAHLSMLFGHLILA